MCIWTREEEEALLTILDDVVDRGQHCDTGAFKSVVLDGMAQRNVWRLIVMKHGQLMCRLGNIFGRDRATGSGAQTARQMTEDSNVNTDCEPHIDWGTPDSPFTSMSVNQNLESDASMSSHSSGRKRARTKAKDNMADQFSEVTSNLINQLSDKFDQGDSNYPKYLARELKRLGFSTTQNVKIGLAMRSNPTFVEVFKVIDNDDERIEFAKSFLDN
ncbi:hypothetical protein FNV43_RR24498 [Rhamnella rubrinervis]|uniref:Uncharacterized protein n=1 Tax=Rhamnella rubrinervis TaxID=2594499 RepID=A0A8K0DRB0_9ROSA|nr:hypothetical protein FNV43_RR24498 [Rhamnella rubrinervis]